MVRLDNAWGSAVRLLGESLGRVGCMRPVQLGMLIGLLVVCTGPHALEGGYGPVELSAGSPWAAVGSLSVNGQLFSATLIGPHHLITAAHVVAGALPANVVFRSAVGTGFSSVAASIQVSPLFNGQNVDNLPGDPSVHADLAVVRLAHPAPPSLLPALPFDGALLGRILKLVSHGGSTTLATMGENRVDVVFSDRRGQAATYLFDFDGPDPSSNLLGPADATTATLGPGREASLIKGDSGSAAFTEVDGQWWLAGVNTFQVHIGRGRGAGGVVLAPFRSWIAQTMREPPPVAAPSPEGEKRPSPRTQKAEGR